VGIDYISYCKTCRVYQDHERWGKDLMDFVHNKWADCFHSGHDVVLTSDYDDLWDYIKEGYTDVKYIGLGGISANNKGEPYREQMTHQEYIEWVEALIELFDET